MLFRQLFDPETSTYTYLLADVETKEAVLIDPVKERVERDLELLSDLHLRLVYALDTHVHADHVTGAGLLRQRTGAKTVVSKRSGAPCADVLVDSGDQLHFGKYTLEVRSTPGHTDGCLTYVTGDRRMAFTGDALLIRGSGRTDFQQGSARALYRSVHDQIFSLPDETQLYPGHDYQGRTVTTVAEEKAYNPRLGGGKSEEEFVAIMDQLDLPRPKRIDEAVPANLKCGLDGLPADDDPNAREGSWAPITRSGSGVPEVTAQWVRAHPEAGRRIDVREPDELRGELGKLDRSENVPLGSLRSVAEAWNRSDPLVVYCRSGGRSGRAALELEAMGFTRVVSMAGGMLAWRASDS